MRKHMKLAAAALGAAALAVTCVPVMAAEYTTSDSVLTIQTPDDTWKEIHDPNTWVTLANGNDTITLLHYSNGETLPAMTVANEHYSKVYQAVLSTRNEVFVVTGSVVDATNFSAVREAVESTVLNKYDTKSAVTSTNTKPASEYSVEGADFTCYVTSSGLNVRAGYSTNEALLGGLSYGDAAHVTGVVHYGGEETGWYRIDYNGASGFISSDFVSESQPEVQEEEKVENTGEEMTLYSRDGGMAIIYKFTNGQWYDEDARVYDAAGAGQWVCEDGSHWSTNPPEEEEDFTSGGGGDGIGVMTLTNNDGDSVTIYAMEDGRWTDADSVIYEAEGAGRWTDSNGNSWSGN